MKETMKNNKLSNDSYQEASTIKTKFCLFYATL